jgi:hypothetical protein
MSLMISGYPVGLGEHQRIRLSEALMSVLIVSSHRAWLREGEQNLVQRFDPDGPLDTIGFFIAKFKKSPCEQTKVVTVEE